MSLIAFKDLKVGDKVKFEDVDILNQKMSGQGEIYGFGRFGFTDLVWVEMKHPYRVVAVPYEEIAKV